MEGIYVIVYASGRCWDQIHLTSLYVKRLAEYVDQSEGFFHSAFINFRNDSKCGKDYSIFTCSSKIDEKPDNAVLPHREGENIHVCGKLRAVKISYRMDGYLFSLLISVLESSKSYRKLFLSHISQSKNLKDPSGNLLMLFVHLRSPKKDILDHSWNERMLTLVLERRELDNAMSWLSTLGGAFSALGDEFDRCALVAGRISIQQMKLALRLGDPYTIVRCKLYLALSLLQRGYLKRAKRMIREQYSVTRSLPVLDIRLIRMCQGIWAKLKYSFALRKQGKLCIHR